MMKSQLTLNRFEMMVSLGCSAEERAQLQPIETTITLYFPGIPSACHTDQLADSVCYAKLSQALIEQVSGQSFHLIEHLAYVLYQCVKKHTGDLAISLSVKKFPPVANLNECYFLITDQ